MKKALLLLLIIVALASCKKVFFEPEPADDPVALYNALWQDFKDHYGPEEARGVDLDSLVAAYRPQVTPATIDDELHSIFTTMMGALNDGHVRLIAPGRKIFVADSILNNHIRDDLFQLDVVRNHYLKPGFKESKEVGYLYGWIGDSVGYVHFYWTADNFFEMNEILNEFANAKALIIDMRHNQGGDFTYSLAEMGRLTNERRLVFTSQTKTGPGENDYTPLHEWYFEPEGEYYNKPIAVLTDHYTISAGERTVMALKTLPNVTLIGEPTAGAISTVVGRELANGWYYVLPTQKVWYADGTVFEGKGIPVNFQVINEKTELENGMDAVIEKALAVL